MTTPEKQEERCVICEQGHDIPHRCYDPRNPNAWPNPTPSQGEGGKNDDWKPSRKLQLRNHIYESIHDWRYRGSRLAEMRELMDEIEEHIERTQKYHLDDLAGTITDQEAKDWKQRIKDSRNIHQHDFRFSHYENEYPNSTSTSSIKISVVVCRECGKVVREII